MLNLKELNLIGLGFALGMVIAPVHATGVAGQVTRQDLFKAAAIAGLASHYGTAQGSWSVTDVNFLARTAGEIATKAE